MGTIASAGLPGLLPTFTGGQEVATVLHTAKESRGAHWFAMLIDPKGSKSVEYYDSSGEGVPGSITSPGTVRGCVVHIETYIQQ